MTPLPDRAHPGPDAPPAGATSQPSTGTVRSALPGCHRGLHVRNHRFLPSRVGRPRVLVGFRGAAAGEEGAR